MTEAPLYTNRRTAREAKRFNRSSNRVSHASPECTGAATIRWCMAPFSLAVAALHSTYPVSRLKYLSSGSIGLISLAGTPP